MTATRRRPPAPAPPYVGPAKYHGAANNKPVDRIVIHSTVGPSHDGAAQGVADYFVRTITTAASAHYIIDAGGPLQVLFDSYVAYHCGYNTHSLGLEMCDNPGPWPTDRPAGWLRKLTKVWRWRDQDHRRVLEHTALLTAQLCAAYDVPAVFLGPADLRAGKRGVTTHANMSDAFHQSTHWDPGAWPRRRFMRMVRRHLRSVDWL